MKSSDSFNLSTHAEATSDLGCGAPWTGLGNAYNGF
jgi:hypothetical protein